MSQTFRSFRYFGKEYTFDEWVRREILKNKGTDTTCFVLEVCKRQGNNILCATCQV